MSSTRRHVTILIIGSGIAGCTAALTLADAGRDVLLINAGPDLDDGNTPLAQGGIIYKAADTPRDAEARALEHDILVAGHRYNNNRAVRFLCRQGPDCVDNMLIERAGVDFDRNEDGTYNLTREGGHGAHRILHKADYSGRALMDGLAAQVKIHPRITCLHNHSAIDLLTTHHHAKNSQYRYSVTNRCLGAYVLNAETGEPETILADWTVLATGGVGQVFLHSTNAPGCVGAGISMAFRAGVELANLEFMQFHPTALYEERSYRRPLITEAMRGEGARLLDDRGEAFMLRHDKRGDLAPRDVVAQAMVEEMLRRGVPCLYLDVSGVKQDLPTRFPTVFNQCLEIGIDIRKEPIPVVPAALKHGKRRAPYSGLGALWGDEAREATPPPRFPDTLRGVTPGEPVTADQMLEAVEKLPERLRRRGYPLAQVSSQRYFLDRAARTLNAEIVVDTGPPALLGEIVVEGNKDVSTTYIRDRAPWKAGTEPWNESRVQDYVDELRGLGLFSMVRQRNIKDVPSPRKDGMVVLPVQLVVREGPPRSVSAAARYETDSGIGVEGEWEHRNFFGNGEKLVVSLPITPEKQGLKASFEKPAFLDRDQKLVGEASLLQEFTDAYDRRGLRVGAGIERRLSPYWWVGVGASSDSGTLTENDRTNEPYSFVGPHLRIVRDSRNNKINPKRGSVLEINSKPIFGYYDGFFTALGTEVEGMFYYAPFRKGPNKGVIDDKLVLAARVRGGSMAGAEMNNLPSTLRYYAGGAGSVRGYSYQAIGPRNDKGDPSGGRSYQIVNLEARYKITDEIGIVPFLDGGMVYEDALPQIFGDMRWGAGLGLRYYTPIGPVRLDVATPLNPVDGDPPLQLYISIGQSF